MGLQKYWSIYLKQFSTFILCTVITHRIIIGFIKNINADPIKAMQLCNWNTRLKSKGDNLFLSTGQCM